MADLMIEGGRPLCGAVSVHGAKNAVLPILAAALLTEKTTLYQCPMLSDVTAAAEILWQVP